MHVLSSEQVSTLHDLAKSAQCCASLDLGFSLSDTLTGDPAVVTASFMMMFEYLGLPWVGITSNDLNEFKVVNGM